MLSGYPQKYSAPFLIPLSPLRLSVVVASINLLHLDLKCVPFDWFWICVFPLNWMSPCLSVTATCRAQHLLLTTVCFIQHRYPQRVVSKLSSLLSLAESFSHPLNTAFPPFTLPWIPFSFEFNATCLVYALQCFIMSRLETPRSVIQQST